ARADRATALDADGAARCAQRRPAPPRSFPGGSDGARRPLAAGLSGVVRSHHPRAGHRATRRFRQRSSRPHGSGKIRIRVDLIATIYGREGDDFNGNGNDTIRGGSGFDTVTFHRDLYADESDFSADSVFLPHLVGIGGADARMRGDRVAVSARAVLVFVRALA